MTAEDEAEKNVYNQLREQVLTRYLILWWKTAKKPLQEPLVSHIVDRVSVLWCFAKY